MLINIEWTDVDGDSNHTVEVFDLPPWMTYDSDSYELTGTPSWSDYKIDPDEVTITVTDSGTLFGFGNFKKLG